MKGVRDPLNVPETLSPPPPGVTAQRWAELIVVCRTLDARANHGARYPQEPERRVENEVVPASLRTTRDRGHAPSRGMTMENPSGKRASVRGDA